MTRSHLVRAAAAAIAGVLLAGGCTTRDRLNPLDPANRETGGFPAFAAQAGNGVVTFQWTRLARQDVAAYAIQRWRPGEAPAPLAGAEYGPGSSGGSDFAVENDSTYVYRLIARFSFGDSAVSLPDTASPGTRYLAVLGAGSPGVFVLSPDARDILTVIPAGNAFEDADIDRDRNVLWLSDPSIGAVFRRGLLGENAGVTILYPGVTDVSVSNLRGVGWLAAPDQQQVLAYGPALDDPSPRLAISGVGRARVVEAGTTDPTVWIGTDEGFVYRVQPSDGSPLEQWSLGSPIRAIALDQGARAAWVVTLRGTVNDLYYLTPGDTTATPRRTGLDNVADVEVEEVGRTLWLSERGRPRAGAGRVSRLAPDGTTLASLAGFEPYGIAVDPGSDAVWVTDLTNDRLLLLDRDATVRRGGPPIRVPYGVIAHRR